jgi:hypothetical protein
MTEQGAAVTRRCDRFPGTGSVAYDPGPAAPVCCKLLPTEGMIPTFLDSPNGPHKARGFR